MIVYRKSERGASMLYVIAALIVTGFIGAAMLKMVTSDRISTAMYSSSATAQSAAKSGIIYAIQQLEDPGKKVQTLALLQGWMDSPVPDQHWFAGASSGPNAYESLIGSSLEFRSRLVAFDTSTFNVTLQAEGIGTGGARASVTSVYHLDGLEFNDITTITPTNALYLGGGADEINTPLIVDGDTYMQGAGNFYTGGHTFKNGEFRRRANGNTSELLLNNCTFDGPAYFIDGNVLFSNESSTFTKGFGGDANFNVNGSNGPNVTGVGAYLNGEFKFIGGTWNGNMKLHGTSELIGVSPASKYSAGSGAGLSKLYSAWDGSAPAGGNGTLLPTAMTDIPNRLSVRPNDPPEIGIDLAKIKAHTGIINYAPGTSLPGIGAKRNLNGNQLNNLYSNNVSRHYIDDNGVGWLIVNMRSGDGSAPFKKGGSGFSKRIILLVEETNLEANTNFYQSSTSGVTLVYVGGNRRIVGLGGCTLFRGMIYSESTHPGANNNSSVIMRANPAMELQGSIYSVGVGRYRMEGDFTLTITYTEPVIKILEGLGVFIDPNASKSIVKTLELKTNFSNPIAELVSQTI